MYTAQIGCLMVPLHFYKITKKMIPYRFIKMAHKNYCMQNKSRLNSYYRLTRHTLNLSRQVLMEKKLRYGILSCLVTKPKSSTLMTVKSQILSMEGIRDGVRMVICYCILIQ